MKKKDVFELLILFGMIGIMILMFASVIYVFDYIQYQDYKEECQRWNDYGYVTEFVGDYGDYYNCLIYMQDGTKLPLRDFKTIAIKEPMLRK